MAEDEKKMDQLTDIPIKAEKRRGRFGMFGGVFTPCVVDITAAEGRDPLERLDLRKARLADLKDYLASRQVVAFPEAVVGCDAIDALAAFLQSYSIGQLRPNTGLLALPPPEAVEKRELLTSQLRLMRAHGMNLAVLSPSEFIDRKPAERVIDIWWRGEKNGSLMTLFAYLVTLNEKWRGATLRLMRIVPAADTESDSSSVSSALQ